MVIRRGEGADLPALLPLAAALGWTEGALRDEFASRVARIAVAVDGRGCALGFVSVREVPPELHIVALAVVEAERRRGVGRALLCHAVADAAECSEALLDVRESNLAARRFYEQLGFREQGLRREYYGDGEDAILLGAGAADLAALAAGEAALGSCEEVEN